VTLSVLVGPRDSNARERTRRNLDVMNEDRAIVDALVKQAVEACRPAGEQRTEVVSTNGPTMMITLARGTEAPRWFSFQPGTRRRVQHCATVSVTGDLNRPRTVAAKKSRPRFSGVGYNRPPFAPASHARGRRLRRMRLNTVFIGVPRPPADRVVVLITRGPALLTLAQRRPAARARQPLRPPFANHGEIS
jgi:hypothetical protein